MVILRFLLLAALCFVAECTVISQECNVDSYCDGNIADSAEDDNCTLLEEEDQLITEAIYTAPQNFTYPAPKSGNLGCDLGEPQQLDATYSEDIFKRVEQAREYIQKIVMTDEKLTEVRSICKNKHANCAFWSVLGECENNPGYMNVNCAPVCQSCEVSTHGQIIVCGVPFMGLKFSLSNFSDAAC
jgi:hypothetical protein